MRIIDLREILAVLPPDHPEARRLVALQQTIAQAKRAIGGARRVMTGSREATNDRP